MSTSCGLPALVAGLSGVVGVAGASGLGAETMGASGVGPGAEYMMRAMSALTQSRYIFLTDDSGIGNPHAPPSVDCYNVTSLQTSIDNAATVEFDQTFDGSYADARARGLCCILARRPAIALPKLRMVLLSDDLGRRAIGSGWVAGSCGLPTPKLNEAGSVVASASRPPLSEGVTTVGTDGRSLPAGGVWASKVAGAGLDAAPKRGISGRLAVTTVGAEGSSRSASRGSG